MYSACGLLNQIQTISPVQPSQQEFWTEEITIAIEQGLGMNCIKVETPLQATQLSVSKWSTTAVWAALQLGSSKL